MQYEVTNIIEIDIVNRSKTAILKAYEFFFRCHEALKLQQFSKCKFSYWQQFYENICIKEYVNSLLDTTSINERLVTSPPVVLSMSTLNISTVTYILFPNFQTLETQNFQNQKQSHKLSQQSVRNTNYLDTICLHISIIWHLTIKTHLNISHSFIKLHTEPRLLSFNNADSWRRWTSRLTPFLFVF